MTKVIIVGPEDVFDYFTSVWSEWDSAAVPNMPWVNWDTQHAVADISQMWAELNDGQLSADSEIVILNEVTFNEQGDELETAIATFAPEALVLVVSYEEDLQAVIRERVAAKQAEYNMRAANFYFINTWEDPIGDVLNHFNAYALEKQVQARPVVSTPQPVAAATPVAASAISNAKAISPVDQKLSTPINMKPYDGTRALIIASTSSKGGSGKTTVALCTASMLYHSSRLAFEQGLAEKPLSVVVVDMDTRDGQIGFLLNQTSPSALNIFLNPDKSVEVIRDNLIYHERLGIHALLAPKRARAADWLMPDFYKDIIEKLSTMFDVVILDTSVAYLDPLLSELVLPISDAVLFVTNLSIGSVYGMTRWMDEVTGSVEDGGAGLPKEKIGIVVNQSLANVGIDQTLLQHAAAGATLLVAVPLDTAAMLTASNHNSLSDIILTHTAISPSYYQLAKKLWRKSELVSPTASLAAAANAGKKGSPVVAAAPTNGMPVSKKVRKGLFSR